MTRSAGGSVFLLAVALSALAASGEAEAPQARATPLPADSPPAPQAVVAGQNLNSFDLPAGGSVTLEFDVVVSAPVPAGTDFVCNQGSLTGGNFAGTILTDDPDAGGVADPTCTPVVASPALAATKSVSDAVSGNNDGQAQPGEVLTYTITVTNSGDEGAASVVIADAAPANTTYDDGSGAIGSSSGASGASVTTNTGSLQVDVTELAGAGGFITVSFTVTVDASVPAGTTQIDNQAQVLATGISQFDSTAASIAVDAAPALALTKDDGGGSTAPGGTVAYTLTVTNNGDRAATGVTFTDTVPANATFNAGASTAGWACVPNGNAGGVCTLNLGSDVAGGGGTAAATFAVDVVDPVAAGVTQISNSASVDAANAPAPANAADTTPVTAAPALALAKDDGGASTVPGGTVAYTLTATNSGNQGATGVTFTDTVPANSFFNVGASTPGWACAPDGNAGGVCTLTLGSDLAGGGGTAPVTFAVTVANPVPAGTMQIANSASVDAANAPAPANAGDTTPLTAAPSLALDKDDGGGTSVPGGTVAYTLTVTNGGTMDATGVVFTDTVPADSTFDAGASTAGWSCADGSPPATVCTLALGSDLPGAGGMAAVIFAVTVDDPVAIGTVISNSASVDAANAPAPAGAGDTTPVLVDTVPPTVVGVDTVPPTGGGLTDGETTTVSFATILVTFSESVQDPPGDTDPDDVTNPANYLLVEAGVDGMIDTVSCVAGPAGDDVPVALAGVTYDDPSRTATVDLGGLLPLGSYAFFVCGSTSILDLAGNPLGGGVDFMLLFRLASIVEIPTLGPLGGALLALLLLAVGWWTLRRRGVGGAAAVVLLALLAATITAGPAAAAELVVDDFDDAQAVSTAATAANQVDQAAGTILGGERDLEVSLLSGTGPITADVDTTTTGALRFDVPASGRGRLLASWDGNDDDAALDATGLGGIDLTGGVAPLNNALRLTVDAVTGTVEVVVEVFTDAANSSRAAATVTATGDLLLTFAGGSPDFATHLGAGATFTNVGAITVELRATGLAAIDVGDLRAVPPAVAALKVDLDTSNAPLASTAPGGTIRYRITVTNTGGEATSVDVADVIAAATTAVGNLKTTPVAFGDSYVATGNVSLSVPAGAGLLANDFDPDGGAVTVDTGASDTATLQGGTVAYVGTAGAFDYQPPSGFTGVDSFTYSIDDDEGQSATATATILLDGLVWFVDDSACGPPPCGSGTLADPFGSFDPTQLGGAGGAGDLDGPNDIIYVRTGSGSTDTGGAAGFELEDGQQLLGEGVDLIVNGQTLVTAGTPPVLTNTAGTPGIGVTLAANNTVRGLNVGDTGGMGFKNAAMATVGTLTVSDVTVQGQGGVMNVDGGGTLAVTLADATSTASATRGISLDGVGGSFTVAGSTTLNATTGTGIHVAGAVAGATFDFGPTAIGLTTAAGAGVDLSASAGATFTFDSLDATTSAGAALAAANAGTVNLGGVANTLVAVGGAALDVSSTAVGAGFTFDTLTSTNSPGAGVRLNGLTGAGTEVTVTGTTTVDNAAGSSVDLDNAGDFTFATVSVQNRGSVGIDLDATGGAVQFGATTVNNQNAAAADGIQITGSTAGSVSFASATVAMNSAAANAIDASGNAAPINFATVNLDDPGADAVLLAGNPGGVAINAGSVDGVTGDGVHSTNTPLTVDLVSFGGTNPITGDGVEIVNSDATSRAVTVQNCNFGLNAGTAGPDVGRGVVVASTGTGSLTADVRFNQIDSTDETILTTDGGTAGSLVLDLQNSTLTRTSAGFTERHAGSGLNSTIVRSWAAPNQVTSTTGGGIRFDRVTFDASGTSLSGTQVGYAGTLQIGAMASRVQGDGLRFDAPSGSLSIGTLNVFNNAGTGLYVDTKTLGTTFTLATGAGTVNTTGGAALFLDPLAASLALASAVSSGSSAAGALFDTVSGTVSIPTLDIDGSTGNGLTIENSSATFTFTTVTVDGTTGAGISLAGNTGSVSLNGGAIGGTDDPGGNAVDIDGGNATVTLAVPVTKSSAGGEVVEVTNRTGGAISFTQQITCNSGCTGMNFANNSGGSTTFSHTAKTVNTGANAAITVASSAGHPINFTNGGLDVDSTTQPAVSVTGGGTIDISGGSGTNNTINATTGAGFTASGGGSLVVTGNAIVTTTTGNAVDISGTTIGGGGVTFRSVSANGATIGIHLANAGTSGFFTVTGSGATDGSGGTIQNTTQNGVLVENTSHINLSNMTFNDAANDGGGAGSCDATVFTGCNAAIEFATVADVNLVNLTITGAEDHGIFGQTVTDLDISNTDIHGLGADVDTNEHGIFIRDLLGTVAGAMDSVFAGVTVDDAQDTAILIENTTATNPGNTLSPDQLTVSDCVLTDAGDSGLDVQTVAANGNLRLVATGNTVTNTVDGIDAEASAGNLQASVGGAGGLINTISAGAGGNMVNGILFFASAANGAAAVDATATDNVITLDAVKIGGVAPVSGLNGIGVSAGGASVAHLGTIRATVQNNTVNSSFSGVLTQTVHGVIVTNEGTGTTSQNVVSIDGNAITLNPPTGTATAETVGIGVDGGTTGAGTTVRSTNNTIVATGDASNGASVGIQILPTELGDPAGTGTRVCVRVTGNNVSTPNNPFAAAFLTTELDVIAAPVVTGSFLDVEAIPPGARTTAQLKADLEPLNTNTEVGDPGGLIAGTITGVMACPN